MEVSEIVERVQRVAAVRADTAGGSIGERQATLVEVRALRSWVDAAEAGVVAEIARRSSFPESSIAEASKGSLGDAGRTIARARTLDAVPGFADALDRGTVTSGHVDQLTRVGASLEPAQREELFERCEPLLAVAEAASTEQWARRVRDEARRVTVDDGIDRLERQRRATSMRTWVDADGMWNLKGRFDPVTGVELASRLDAAVETLFAERTPATCPPDPVDRQHHLRALALARLLDDSGGPQVDSPIPVEVP